MSLDGCGTAVHLVRWSRRLLASLLVLAATLQSSPAAHAAGPPTLEVLPNAAVSLPINTALAPNISARLVRLDDQGRTETMAGVNVTFTAPASGAGGTFGPSKLKTATVATNSSGVAAAPIYTANYTVGTYAISVTAPGAAAASVSVRNEANPNLAASLAWVGNPQAVFINHVLEPPLAVQVLNSENHGVIGLTVTFRAPSSGPSGTFADSHTSTTTTVTDAAGVARAAAFTANRVGGDPYPVIASVAADRTTTGTALSDFVTLMNVNDPAGQPQNMLVLAGANQQAAVMSPFKTNLQVLVLDGFDLPLEGADVVFTAPPTGASGTFSFGSRTFATRTNAAGQALAPIFTANGNVGLYSVTIAVSLNGVSLSRAVTFSNTRVGTRTGLATTPDRSAAYGESVDLTASVRPATGSLMPSAAVQFTEGNTALPACSALTPVGGQVTCTLAGLAPGSYTFGANYVGDAASQPSASAGISYTVRKADSRLTLTSSSQTAIHVLALVRFSAEVARVAPGAGTPTGLVQFSKRDGTSSVNLGDPVPLVNGSAEINHIFGTASTFVITATYTGDGIFNASSSTLTQLVPYAAYVIGLAARAHTGAQINRPFEPLPIKVYDWSATGLPGVRVTIRAPDSRQSGTFADTHTNTTTAISDANGIATPAQFIANGIQGTYELTASVSPDQTQLGDTLEIRYFLKNMLEDPNAMLLLYPYFLNSEVPEVPVGTTLQYVAYLNVQDGNGVNIHGANVVVRAPTSGASGTFPDGSSTFTTTTNETGEAYAPTFMANDTVGTYTLAIEVSWNGMTRSTAQPLTNVRVGTSTSLSVAPAGTSMAGEPTVLNATVKPEYGALVPRAPVEFTSGGVAIDTCRGVVPVAGVATCRLTAIAAGNYSFAANYVGDSASAFSVSTVVPHLVVPSATVSPSPTESPIPTPTQTPTPMPAPPFTPPTVNATPVPAPPQPQPVTSSAPAQDHDSSAPASREEETVVVGEGGGGGGGFGGLWFPASPSSAQQQVTAPVDSQPAAAQSDVAVPTAAEETAAEPAPTGPQFATVSIGLIEPAFLVPGDWAQLSLLLLNPGTLDASADLVVRDVLPAGLAFEAVLSEGWSCAFDELQVLTCILPAALIADSQTTLQLLVLATAEDTLTPLVNTAWVSSPSLDPNMEAPMTVDALSFLGFTEPPAELLELPEEATIPE